MNKYYCINCYNLVGFFNKIKKYFIHYDCNFIESKNINSIFFMECDNCNKFIGIKCYNVCENCFGENQILEELFNWFQKYKKTKEKKSSYKNMCNVCKKYKFRQQYWFFEELTCFYKI